MKRTFALFAAWIFVISAVSLGGRAHSAPLQTDLSAGNAVTIVVTPQARNKKEAVAAAKLTADDFAVKENGRPQKVVSARRAGNSPLLVELLIQDNLRTRTHGELKGLQDFILGLPEGSRVFVGYLTTGSMDVRHDFTTDRQAAAESIRVLTGQSPNDPYVEVIEALKRFDSQPQGRRIIVLLSDGLDLSHGVVDSNPDDSIDLGRAIREAQARGVAIFSFFESAIEPGNLDRRLGFTFGEGSLDHLAAQTGGDSFLGPTDVVSLTPYLAEMKDELSAQWLVTYQSANTGSGIRKVQVTAEQRVHLHYAHGYWVK